MLWATLVVDKPHTGAPVSSQAAVLLYLTQHYDKELKFTYVRTQIEALLAS